MPPNELPSRACLRAGLLALALLPLAPAGPAAADPPLTAEQKERLKERDRLDAERDQLLAKGDFAAAIDREQKLLAIERGVYGDVHEEVSGTLCTLTSLSALNEDFPAARTAAREALAVATKLYGDKHWRVTNARLAGAFAEQLAKLGAMDRARLREVRTLMVQVSDLRDHGKVRQAIPLARKALALRQEVLGNDHVETAYSLDWLAGLLREDHRFAEAQTTYDQALALYKKTVGEEHPDTAWVLQSLGELLQGQGKYAAARPYFDQALAVREKVHGKEHRQVAWVLGLIGRLLKDQGRYAEARLYLERVLAMRIKVQGEEHREVATALGDMGSILSAQYQFTQALPYYEKALALYQKLLGEDHPNTITALNNLGVALDRVENAVAARPYLEKALALRQKLNGEDHPGTAACHSNLGSVLQTLGEYTAARRHVEQALAAYKKALGPQHPQTAVIVANLGYLAQEQGDYAAARACYDQSLAVRQKFLGPDHPDTALTLSNLAELLEQQGDFQGAGRLLEQVLAVYRKAYGEDHPTVGRVLRRLGHLRASQGDFAGARPFFDQSLALYRKAQGNDHPNTAGALSALGNLLRDQGDHAGALPCYEQALAIYRKTVGDHHRWTLGLLSDLGHLLAEKGDYKGARARFDEALACARGPEGWPRDLANALNDVAGLLKDQGLFKDARPYYEEALALDRKYLGDNNPATVTMLSNLGGLLNYLGDYPAARQCLEKALESCQKNLAPDSPMTAHTLVELGILLETQGDLRAARRLLTDAVAMYCKVRGEDHPDTAHALVSLGSFHRDQGEFAAARRCLDQALAIYQKVKGPEHPYTAHAFNYLGVLTSAQGDQAQARDFFEKALVIRRKVLGEEHFSTAQSLVNVGSMLREEDPDRARQYIEKALAIETKVYGEDDPTPAHTRTWLAGLLQDRKDHAEARKLHERIVASYKHTLGAEHPETASALMGLADVLRDLGDYAGARRCHEQALAARREAYGNNSPAVSTSLFFLGDLLLVQGDFAGALDRYEEARAIRAHLYDEVLGNLAEVEALRFLEEYRPGRNPTLSALRRLPGLPAAKAYQVVWETRGLATRAVLARRPPAGADPKPRAVWEDLRNVRSQLARLALAPVLPEAAEARQNHLARLTAEKEALERKLAAASAAFRRQQEARHVQPADLARLLPPSAAVLDLVEINLSEPPPEHKGGPKLTPHYEAFVLRRAEGEPGYTVAWVHLGPAEPVNQALKAWRKVLAGRGASAPADRGPEAVLRRLVWQPVEKHLAGCTAVVVVPDGQLTGLPWAALPGRRPGSFLLEDYGLATAIDGQLLYAVLSRKPPAGEGVLVVGGVQYDSPSALPPGEMLAAADHRGPARKGQLRWAYLPGTEKEAADIAALYPDRGQVTVLAGDEASEPALRRRMPQARYLHLATHGFFADPSFRSVLQDDSARDRPSAEGKTVPGKPATAAGRSPLLLTGVVLAGANRPPALERDGQPVGDDGILTGEEVAELDLGRAELVVLSACETGLGEVAGGEGVFGLQRAFHLAGARSVVASLWQVDDRATQRLMELFYENLWEKKLPRLEALRQAQLVMLRGQGTGGQRRGLDLDEAEPEKGASGAAHASPRLWAAWALSGDPGDLANLYPAPAAPTDSARAAPSRPGPGSWLLMAVLLLALPRLGAVLRRPRHHPASVADMRKTPDRAAADFGERGA